MRNDKENIKGDNVSVENKALGTGDCAESKKPELLGQIDTLRPGGLHR
jgi:hypothetical protein